MVAHLVWDQGVAGSSPVFPTFKAPAEMLGLFCYMRNSGGNVFRSYQVCILKSLKDGLHYIGSTADVAARLVYLPMPADNEAATQLKLPELAGRKKPLRRQSSHAVK